MVHAVRLSNHVYRVSLPKKSAEKLTKSSGFSATTADGFGGEGSVPVVGPPPGTLDCFGDELRRSELSFEIRLSGNPKFDRKNRLRNRFLGLRVYTSTH